MAQDALLSLTEHLYDAATGATPWREVGQRLLTLTGARTGVLMQRGAAGEDLLFSSNLSTEAVQDYRRHYHNVDLWTHRAAAASMGSGAEARVWNSGTLVRDQEFLRSEFYDDFGRRHGLRYVIGAVAPLGAAGLMPIGLHRPDGGTPFGETERRLLEALMPQLRRAMQLRHRLAAVTTPAAPAGLEALDALSLGVVILDAEMTVLAANLAAEGLIGASRALRFTRQAEGPPRLVAGRHEADEQLRRMVRATALAGHPGGAQRLADEAGLAELVLLVSPLPRRISGGEGGPPGRVPGQALLLLRPLQQASLPDPALLRTLFGLTRAEAETAVALCLGDSKGEVARLRGLRETTIRTQTRAVLEKTGSANLRELALRLGQIAAP